MTVNPESAPLRGGYPLPGTIELAYEAVDLNRAVQAYRHFYRSVSGAALFDGTAAAGARPNEVFGYLDAQPRHVGFTLNSDTPYGAALLDLHAGPMVIDVPEGAFVGAVFDIHQRWILDFGLSGPDAGAGGKHVVLPPGYDADVPDGHHVGTAEAYRVLAAVRAIPQDGDVAAALKRIATVTIHPMEPSPDWSEPVWVDMTAADQDTTPLAIETGMGFWQALHRIVDAEPVLADSRAQYGELAALGIAKGQPFEPDSRLTQILELAAKTANLQMRTESFADRTPARLVWPERQWEWVALRSEGSTFDTPGYRDTYAMDKWFFQAIATSPAMFRRDPGTGSLYWLALSDRTGAYLDGANNYTLTVPLPVPATLFWSVTVYDATTRSQVQTDQGRAALRSKFELSDLTGDSVVLHFGPEPPEDAGGRWIKTIPDSGWFAYFRIYGPDGPAFDGTWKPGDLELS
ncbi:DUF1254 domain-containing protein [Mycolicibacterium mengxianglii]|uniref:DUF1254 domain-containing protein n=1 Tax=Mycolicibacterium mengxianglii TaxID=2736649 RepID=UPI0018EED3FB|nr:DUF1254 domain-containing protein [Mycolicibacterium mengxianglii]